MLLLDSKQNTVYRNRQAERLNNRVLRMRWGSRALLVGQTGSGKTTLARVMLQGLTEHDIVILDPKANFDFPNAQICESVEEMLNAYAPVKTFRPNRGRGSIEEWNAILGWIYDRQNTVLYIDETYGIGIPERRSYPPELLSIYTRGRERGITVIAATQRPRFVPLYMLTESQKFCIFRLSNGDDRKYIADQTSPAIREAVTGHQFWFYDDSTGDSAVKLKLAL